MSLVVPLLRLVLLFFNVWETYKTLKPPRPSARTGEPSENATRERKRNLKGCMACWIVWAAYTVAERIADSILGIFVPFYSEFKASFLIFVLVARARGAEPLYMYFLRPMIIPYASTLEWVFTQTNTVGDFAALLIFFPTAAFIQWWNPSGTPLEFHFTPSEEELAQIQVHTNVSLEHVKQIQRKPSRRTLSATATLRKRPSVSFNKSRRVASGNEPRPKIYASQVMHGRSVSSGEYRATSTQGRSSSATIQHEVTTTVEGTASHHIWMPPQSAYEDEGEADTMGGEVPVAGGSNGRRSYSGTAGQVEPELDERMEEDEDDEAGNDDSGAPAYPPTQNLALKPFMNHSNGSQRRVRSVSENDTLRPGDTDLTELGHFEPYVGTSRPPLATSQSLPLRSKGKLARVAKRHSEKVNEDGTIETEMDYGEALDQIRMDQEKGNMDLVVEFEDDQVINTELFDVDMGGESDVATRGAVHIGGHTINGQGKAMLRPRTREVAIRNASNRASMLSTRTNSGSTTMTGYTSLRTSVAISSSQSGSGSEVSTSSRGRRGNGTTVTTAKVPTVTNMRSVATIRAARGGAPKAVTQAARNGPPADTVESSEGEGTAPGAGYNQNTIRARKKRRVAPQVVRNLSSASESYNRTTTMTRGVRTKTEVKA